MADIIIKLTVFYPRRESVIIFPEASGGRFVSFYFSHNSLVGGFVATSRLFDKFSCNFRRTSYWIIEKMRVTGGCLCRAMPQLATDLGQGGPRRYCKAGIGVPKVVYAAVFNSRSGDYPFPEVLDVHDMRSLFGPANHEWVACLPWYVREHFTGLWRQINFPAPGLAVL